MGETISDVIDNYNNNIDKENELAEIVKGAKLEEMDAAKEIISKINAQKLSSLIETTFKWENGRQRYGDMKKNPFYNFYVGATIDLLSDKLLDSDCHEMKFSFNWKDWTLDEHLKNLGWIDNNYSRNLVKLTQKAMWIKDAQQDGFAWPQFFAKACSILSWKWISEFSVNWFNWNNKYKFDLDDDIANYNQQVEADNNKKAEIVKNGNLVELAENFSNRPYYWIPEGVKVYMKNDYNGYYYFNNNKIVFVPDLSKWNYPICLQEADISNIKEFPSNPNSWNMSYPTNCGAFHDKLNSILSNSLSPLWIDSTSYSLDFENTSWKYVLKSYWNSIPIQLGTITSWWIYSNDLWHNLQLLNLCNYLKSKHYRWTFSFNRSWQKILLNNEELNDIFAFDNNHYKKVNDEQQKRFVTYLNTNLYT